MIEFVAILLATYMAAVADTAFAPALAVLHAAPCLLPLIVIVTTIAAAPSPWRVAQMAVVGLAFDFNSGGHAGVGMASFALVAFAVGQARGPLRRLEPIEQALATAPLVAAMLLLVAIGNFLFGEALDAPVPMFARALAASVYTAALSLPIWMLIDWLRESRRLRPATSHR